MKLLLLGNIGAWEIILVVLLVLLLFGGKKIPELMKGIGKGVKSFRDGLEGTEVSLFSMAKMGHQSVLYFRRRNKKRSDNDLVTPVIICPLDISVVPDFHYYLANPSRRNCYVFNEFIIWDTSQMLVDYSYLLSVE